MAAMKMNMRVLHERRYAGWGGGGWSLGIWGMSG